MINVTAPLNGTIGDLCNYLEVKFGPVFSNGSVSVRDLQSDA